MKITVVRVMDLDEASVASGLPMLTSYDEKKFEEELWPNNIGRHQQRMAILSDTPIGSGHSNALSGILVSMNITASVKWWQQFQRYHFAQIVSSQSTMHRLRKMLQEDTATFSEYVPREWIEELKRMANDPECKDEAIIMSCPMGLELTARVATNYLQLRTIYHQRINHKLKEWQEFCAWIFTLPLAPLITR